MRQYVKASAVRDLVNSHGRRMGKEFLWLLNDFLEDKINQACSVHNGNKKTLDASVAGFIGLKKGRG